MANRINLNQTSFHGAGAINEIAAEVKIRGLKKALVCSDPDLIKFNVTTKVTKVLEDAGLEYELYSDIKPNPTIQNVQHGVEAFKKAAADYIIAIGGGSSMDTSKAIGIIIANPEFEDVRSLEGTAPTKNPCVPIIAVPTTAGNGNLILYRSNAPDAELCMSGLGFYAVQKTSTDRTVANMFGLQAQTFESYLEELLGHGEWQPIDWPDNTEFLRLDPPFSKGYWQKLPSKDKRISLARYGDPQKNYVFYRYHNGIYQQKPIPDWRIRNYFPENTSNDSSRNMYGEYRRIAIALLKRYGTLPGSEVKASGDLIEIKLGYRLPPSEEEFFKLYSWPVRYDFSSKLPPVFTRKMTRQIYPMFKHELESIGYCFVEE